MGHHKNGIYHEHDDHCPACDGDLTRSTVAEIKRSPPTGAQRRAAVILEDCIERVNSANAIFMRAFGELEKAGEDPTEFLAADDLTAMEELKESIQKTIGSLRGQRRIDLESGSTIILQGKSVAERIFSSTPPPTEHDEGGSRVDTTSAGSPPARQEGTKS